MPGSSARRQRRLTYLAVYVALSAAFCWPLFVQPFNTGSGDWDQHLFYYAAPLRNAAFGQLPFWNPWYCGGNVLWQNPQVSLISPVYLLSLVMPLTLAMKINVLGHYIVGCLGMHLVVRRLIGVQSPAMVLYLVALSVFAGSMALHLAAGHSVFLGLFWLPALVYCFWRATAGRVRHVLLGGAMIGVIILNGGAHVVPLVTVLLVALGVGALVAARTVRPLVLAVVTLALGAAYAAPRLAPSVAFITSDDFNDRRPTKRPDFMTVEMLQRSFWDASQGTPTRVSPDVQRYGWQEYGNYLGWFGGVLMLVSAGWILVFRWRREYWKETSAALGFVGVVLLTAGEFAPWAPASVMRDLSFTASFRIPSRFTLLVPLFGAMCAAFAARALERTAMSSIVRRAAQVLCIVGLAQLVLVNRAHFPDAFVVPPVDNARLFERQTPTIVEREIPSAGPAGVERTNLLGSMLAGASPLTCYEPLQLKKVATLGPIAISGEGAITVSDSTFTPNRVSATVTVGPAPVRVVLNQNFAAGWKTNVGPVEADPHSGRPSVVIPAGYTGEVAFSYVPPGLWAGVFVWTLTMAASILAWHRDN